MTGAAGSEIENFAEIASDDGADCDSTADNDNTNDGIVQNDDVGSGCDV
jgi:hypothetical protein